MDNQNERGKRSDEWQPSTRSVCCHGCSPWIAEAGALTAAICQQSAMAICSMGRMWKDRKAEERDQSKDGWCCRLEHSRHCQVGGPVATALESLHFTLLHLSAACTRYRQQARAYGGRFNLCRLLSSSSQSDSRPLFCRASLNGNCRIASDRL